MVTFKKIGNFLTDILIIILTLCFFVALYHYASIKILNHSYTNFLGYTYFNIKTGSMTDTINIDDYVFIKITKDVQVDDIISYVGKDNEVITHRLKQINENGELITRGDANDTDDDPIKSDQVIGKVIKVGVQFGVVLKIITEPVVLIAFFAAVLLINLAITNYKKKKYEEINEEIVIPKIKTPIIPTNEEEQTQIYDQLKKMIEEQQNAKPDKEKSSKKHKIKEEKSLEINDKKEDEPKIEDEPKKSE